MAKKRNHFDIFNQGEVGFIEASPNLERSTRDTVGPTRRLGSVGWAQS